MKYAIHFALMSLAAFWLGVGVFEQPLTRAVAVWVSIAFAIVSGAYATRRPAIFMKRTNGGRPMWSWLLLGPYFTLASLSLAAYAILRRRKADCAEIANGVFFAQRPRRASLTSELAVLDLAAEFPRVPSTIRAYKSLPALDGLPLTLEALREGVAWIDEQLVTGPVMVHCALGHGRTGSVVIAWMLSHQLAKSVDDAAVHLSRLRPAFGISASQRAQVVRFSESLHPRG